MTPFERELLRVLTEISRRLDRIATSLESEAPWNVRQVEL